MYDVKEVVIDFDEIVGVVVQGVMSDSYDFIKVLRLIERQTYWFVQRVYLVAWN